jgi:hypothetical protein
MPFKLCDSNLKSFSEKPGSLKREIGVRSRNPVTKGVNCCCANPCPEAFSVQVYTLPM